MATAKASYIDENGNRRTGYTKDIGIYADFLQSAANDKNGLYSAMLQKNAEDVQGQIDRLNSQYDQLNTQLYRDYMQSKKNLPQQLAAQGISGGLSETSRLGLDADYQDGLNQNEQARINGIWDIQSAGNNAQLSILQDYWKDAAERANVMASIGDFSGYKALGYTDEQIAALKAAWDAQNAPKVRYYPSYADPNPPKEPEPESPPFDYATTSYYVPGIGEITDVTAEQLEAAGVITIIGKDENRDPIFSLNGKRPNFSYATRI